MGTRGTVQSQSYPIEIKKFFPDVSVYQQACPMLVPLIESREHETEGADFFIKKYATSLLNQSENIDTVLLACTHYPLLQQRFKQFLPDKVTVISQGDIVAESLVTYLSRHPEVEEKCSKNGQMMFYTTDSKEDFDRNASIFYGKNVESQHTTTEHLTL
jgi:glutamate racemase